MAKFTVGVYVPQNLSRDHDVGSGDTLLAALEDFAAIGWEEEPDVLLRTVVWVRDEEGRIVATGHYRPSRSTAPWPALDVFAVREKWTIYREEFEGSYKAHFCIH